MGTTVNGNEAMEKPHTLEDYAIDHFRPPPKVRFILLWNRIAHPKKIGKVLSVCEIGLNSSNSMFLEIQRRRDDKIWTSLIDTATNEIFHDWPS